MDRAAEMNEVREAVGRVLRGDRNAFSVIVSHYERPIYNLMYRLTGSEADALDLTQEAFVRVFENLHRYSPRMRFFPWIYTVGLNVGRNFLRRSGVTTAVPEGVIEEAAAVGCDLAESEEAAVRGLDCQRVREALLRLPAEYREAVVLHYHEECSMREVASALGLSVSGAKMRVGRGLRRLRALVLGDGHE